MGIFDSTRGGSGSTTWFARCGALAMVAAVFGCFRPDYLDYVACRTSEPCAEVGLAACVIVSDAPELAGFCADRCEVDSDCPAGQDGDAAQRCLIIAERRLCALDCLGDRTCPDGYLCRSVRDGEANPRELCFPEVDS